MGVRVRGTRPDEQFSASPRLRENAVAVGRSLFAVAVEAPPASLTLVSLSPCPTNVRAQVTPLIERPEDAPVAFQSAWNAHDMSAFGRLFHADATFVNRFAHYVRGVEEIVALHRPVHETIYRDSTLENELIDVTAVGADTAIVHFWSRLHIGPAHPTGAHDIDTLILAVVTRGADGWRIQALENVTLTNPRTGESVLRR